MASSESPPQPDFIAFLISEKPKFDCHFIVGEETLVKPERIGAVKLMLMAHSVVFRSELEESGLKEKGDVALKDVYPDTFKDLLKFVYGQDITGDLEFDEADNMFYVAEKYMMSYLKNKLALRLIALLTPQNVCSLMNNPAISMQLQLKSAITQILRHETDKVLASPLFLDVCPEGFISILQQDGLAVPEIELWRAAIKWAKKRASSGEGDILRGQISRLAKHLRICTIGEGEFIREIVPTKVLTSDEESAVFESINSRERQESLTTFSNEIQPRTNLQRQPEVVLGERTNPQSQEDQGVFVVYHKKLLVSKQVSFVPIIKSTEVTLKPLDCLVKAQDGIMSRLSQFSMFASTCQVDCKVTIIRLNRLHFEPAVRVVFSERVRVGRNFSIPLTSDGENIKLLPDSKYLVRVEFADNSIMCESCVLTLDFTRHRFLYQRTT